MVAATTEPVLTEKRILETATALFYERGYRATTMRDIAAGVGIKAGSLYNHYAAKQDILLRICLKTSRALYEGACNAIEGIEDVGELLRAFIVWHVSFHGEHRHASRVTDLELRSLDAAARATVVEIRDKHENLLRTILARGLAEGRWRSQNIRIISIGIATMCTEVDAWYRDDGPLTPQQIGEIYADFIGNGLRVP